MPTPNSILTEILLSRTIVKREDKLPLPALALHKYNLDIDEYTNLCKSLANYKHHASDTNIAIKDSLAWAAGFCLFIVENYSREYKVNWSWELIEKSIDCSFSENDRKSLIDRGLNDFWRRPIYQCYDHNNDHLDSLLAEVRGLIKTPLVILNEVSLNLVDSKRITPPLYLYKVNNNQYIDLKNSLIFYPLKDDKNEQYARKAWAAAFCIFITETFQREYNLWRWEEFEVLIGCDFDRQQRAELVTLGLESFWCRSVFQKKGTPNHLETLLAESGGVIRTPKAILFEIVARNELTDNYLQAVSIETYDYDELRNSLSFYNDYPFNNDEISTSERLAWSACSCLFISATYGYGKNKINWCWEDFEKLINCNFNDHQRVLLIRQGLNDFWKGSINESDLLGSLLLDYSQSKTEENKKPIISSQFNEKSFSLQCDVLTIANNVDISVSIDSSIFPEESKLNDLHLDSAINTGGNRLKTAEAAIREEIKKEDFPFLGIYGSYLDVEIQEAIENEIIKRSTVEGYISLIKAYPALFSIYLARSIAKGTGENGGGLEIYPLIAKALNLNPPTDVPTTKRESLWAEFRKACQNLGVEVSPRTSGQLFMSDEYLLQTGIPDAFLGNVVKKMVNLVEKIGLPPTPADDPEEFSRWQCILINQMDSNFPQTARRSLQLDKNGFYLSSFIKLYNSDSEPNIDWEKVIYQCIRRPLLQVRQVKLKLEIPQLIYRNNQVGVLLPSTTSVDQRWEILIKSSEGDSTQNYQATANEIFIPLIWDPIVFSVQIHNISSDLKYDFDLWLNGQNNRLLVFSTSGVIVYSGSLADDEIQLVAGTYVVVSRFESLDFNCQAINQQPDVFLSDLDLATGDEKNITNGVATLKIKANRVAMMRWNGISATSNEGHDIFASNELKLIVSVENISEYRVILSSNFDAAISLEISDSLEATFKIAEKLSQSGWKAGLTKLVAVLYSKGSKRAITRSSIWIWIGLSSIDSRVSFNFSRPPKNLNQELSENITQDPIRLTYDSSENNPYFSFVFDLANNKTLTLTWRVPGVYLELEDVLNNLVTYDALPCNSVVSVTHSSPRNLRIFTNLNGTLQLGGFSQYVDFEKKGECCLPLAPLLGYVDAQQNTLTFTTNTDVKVDLIKLVLPSITQFNVDFMSNSELEITIYCTNPLDSLRVQLHELCTDRSINIDAGRNPHVQHNRTNGLTNFPGEKIAPDNWKHTLLINYSNWQDGLWLINFETEWTNNNWKPLSNSQELPIAMGFMLNQGARCNIEQFTAYYSPALLARVTQKLTIQYADISWIHVSWLDGLWERLIQQTYLNTPKIICGLLGLLRYRTETNGWIPPNILARIPELVAQPVNSYSGMDAQNNLLLTCLKYSNQIVNDLQNNLTQRNITRPTYFNAFRQIIVDRIEPAKPSQIQELLVPNHYKYAQHRLEQCYQKSLEPNINNNMLGWSLRLSIILNNPELQAMIFPNLPEGVGSFVLAPIRNNQEFDNQMYENINGLERLISILAFASRLDALDDNHNYFDQINQVAQHHEIPLKIVLTYTFTVAEELLGFYLLFWEFTLTNV